MVKKITFLKDHRCFKKDTVIDFKQLTLLVGDQGCGKSSLIELISHFNDKWYKIKCKEIVKIEADEIQTKTFDFEKDNLRTKSSFSEKVDMRIQVGMGWISHGESNKLIIKHLLEVANTCFIQDEPDTGMSPRSCYWIADMFKKSIIKDNQIIACIHSPIIMQEIGEVFSLEHMKWMAAEDFLTTQKT